MTAKPTDPDTPFPKIVTQSARLLIQERNAFVAALERYSNDPQPGCGYLIERDGWKHAPQHKQRAHRRRVWTAGMNLARLINVQVVDQLWALHRLLTGDSLPVFAHMPLSRVACEAAMRVCFLLDPDIGYELRLLRTAVLRLDSAEAKVTAARALPPNHPVIPHALNRATAARDELLDQIRRAGITNRTTKGKRTHLVLAGKEVQTRLGLTRLVEQQFTRSPTWYRLTSGVVHSTEWMLEDPVTSAPTQRDLVVEPDLLEIGAAVMAALDAASAVAEAYARFYGHDGGPAARASERRYKAIDMLMQEWFIDRSGSVGPLITNGQG